MELPFPALYVIQFVFVLAFVFELFNYVRGNASKNWIAHEATILKAWVKTRTDNEDNTEEHRPFIRYQYQYQKRVYTGKKVAYGNRWSSHYARAYQSIQGLRPGEKTVVFLHPNKPSLSVLYTGYQGNLLNILAPILALAFIHVAT